MTRSFTLVAALALAAARRNDEGWSHVGDAEDDVQIELAFALRHEPARVAALGGAPRALGAGSPLYGEWLSNGAVHALVAPAPDAVDAVVAHAAARGARAVRRARPSGGVLVATVGVRDAGIVGAKYARYEHAAGGAAAPPRAGRARAAARGRRRGRRRRRADGPLPAAPRAPRATAAASAPRATAAATQNTPAVLRALCNVTGVGAGAATRPDRARGDGVPRAGERERSPLSECSLSDHRAFLEQYFSEADLGAFWSAYGVEGAAEPAVALVGDGATGARGGVSRARH